MIQVLILAAIARGMIPLGAVLAQRENLPESVNAYRERLSQTGDSGGRIPGEFCALAALGPLGALLGYACLADRPALLGAMMLLAAGHLILG